MLNKNINGAKSVIITSTVDSARYTCVRVIVLARNIVMAVTIVVSLQAAVFTRVLHSASDFSGTNDIVTDPRLKNIVDAGSILPIQPLTVTFPFSFFGNLNVLATVPDY
jgi:hypothetical protein